MSIIEFYSIVDLNVQIEYENQQLAEEITRAFHDYFFTTKNASVLDSYNLTLRFKNNDFYIKAPEAAQEIYASSCLRVFKDENFYYLISGDSLFQLDLGTSLGIGLLDSAFWERHPRSKQDFLMLSLLWLLRQHGVYALHANGVVKNDVGILIVGDTGKGKSTTALSLIRQGWGYLSDDVTLIRHTLDGIEAIAFLKGFSFDSSLVNCYPELNKPSSFNEQKRFLDIKQIYPGRFRHSCFPKALIFPEIVSNDKSELIPIDRTKALVLLAENSGGIMVDKEIVIKQMEVLKRLAYQTSSYKLLAGRDLYEESERISEILLDLATN
ncbi:MAG TPA: hypothetical protein VNN20_13325 [Thermodesulfobacteriota bacterium]|nr:hypothetical protein [Thermodesulfobacteriota bacterium]